LNNNNGTREITLTALSAAFVTVATMLIRIPHPLTKGYINIGDAAVIAVAMVLGKRLGWLAGGLGSALADLLGVMPLGTVDFPNQECGRLHCVNQRRESKV